VGWNVVSPSYFETLRLPLLAGRAVAPSDDERAPAVAVVNEAMVRRFWPGEVPIGRRFGNEGRELVVVGVARDSAYHRVGERPTPHFYVPFAQRYNARMSVIARPAADPTGVAALLRREVRGLDRDLPILDAMPLAEFIAIALLPQRVAGTVAGMLGAVGLLLAGVGIYAVTAAFVAQRTREIGVRLAVGAALGDVVRLVLREGLGLAAAGVAVGGIAAAATTRLLRGLLPGVSPTDPATFAVVAALMAAAALGACAVPAWRAVRVDPTAALRAE
jgi:predicted permease